MHVSVKTVDRATSSQGWMASTPRQRCQMTKYEFIRKHFKEGDFLCEDTQYETCTRKIAKFDDDKEEVYFLMPKWIRNKGSDGYVPINLSYVTLLIEDIVDLLALDQRGEGL
jgi:hypothetical protein